MRRGLILPFGVLALVACADSFTGPEALRVEASRSASLLAPNPVTAITGLAGDEDNFGFGAGEDVPCGTFNNASDDADQGVLDRTFPAGQDTPFLVDLTADPNWRPGMTYDSVHFEFRETSTPTNYRFHILIGHSAWRYDRFSGMSFCGEPVTHIQRLNATWANALVGNGQITVRARREALGAPITVDWFRMTFFTRDVEPQDPPPADSEDPEEPEEPEEPEPVAGPPVADAGAAQVVECTGEGCGDVTLDGALSHHPDEVELSSFEWLDEGGELLATGATPTVSLPLGTHRLTLRVTDANGLSDEAEVEIAVVDTTAPELTVAVSPETIWPPNGQYHAVEIQALASDVCVGQDELSLVARVSSSEAETDGSAGQIRVVRADGSVAVSSAAEPVLELDPRTDRLEVRAERSGNGGSGRVYTIAVEATDPSGNAAAAEATVTVPHDARPVTPNPNPGRGRQ